MNARALPDATGPAAAFPAPRAAYVHVPFCRHRCGYCSFTLVAGRDDLIERYLHAVRRELEWRGTPHVVDTLYFGGGTPTHLAPSQFLELVAAVRRWFPLAAGGEFSVEANPADLDAAYARTLGQAGVTRVSLGAQSFDPDKLRLLERDHRAPDIRRACEAAANAGLTVSLDLIFAAPGETRAGWERDLAAAVALEPHHLSTYGLTFERGTQFWSRLRKGQLTAGDEATEAAMYETALDRLPEAGYEQYEVSNFARPGYQCRHNEVYWSGQPYDAVGPGAARFLDGRREMNHRSTTTYLRRMDEGQSPVAEVEQLPPREAALERLVFGLRRRCGVDTVAFAKTTGFVVRQLAGPALERLIGGGFLEHVRHHLRLTRRGLMVADSVAAELLDS